MREEAEQGDEYAEEQIAALSECLVAEQTAYIARRDLKEIKAGSRPPRWSSSGADKRDGDSQADRSERKKRIEESKKRTRCRDCGQLGHWSGDPDCPQKDKSLPPRGDRAKFGKARGRGKSKGKGAGSYSRYRDRTRHSYFAVCDENDNGDEHAYVAAGEQERVGDRRQR